jgi:hypothetical protein
MIAHREVEGGSLPDLSQHGEVVLTAVGHVVCRRIRHSVEKVLSLACQLGQFGDGPLKLLLLAGKLLEFLLRRLTCLLLLLGAQRLHSCSRRSPYRINLEQVTPDLLRSLAGQLGQESVRIST